MTARYDEDTYLDLHYYTPDEDLESDNDRKIKDKLVKINGLLKDLEKLTKDDKTWFRTIHLDIPQTGYEIEITDGEWRASAY